MVAATACLHNQRQSRHREDSAATCLRPRGPHLLANTPPGFLGLGNNGTMPVLNDEVPDEGDYDANRRRGEIRPRQPSGMA